MKTITMRAIAALLSLAVAWTPRAGGQENRPGRAGTTQRPSAFREVGKDAGLLPHVAGIWGHGAGWGDVDGDRWIDLYVGTFHYARSKPNLFFRNVKGKFRLDDRSSLREKWPVFMWILYPACLYLGQFEFDRQGKRGIGGKSASAWVVTNNKAQLRCAPIIIYFRSS